MLCPLFSAPCLPVRPRLSRSALAGLLALGLASAQATTATGNGQNALFEATRQWVARSQQLPPEQVRVAPLDSRVKVEACEQGLQFDYPFSQSRETVRVRCAVPDRPWQLFLRLLPPSGPSVDAATTPGAPPVAPSAAAAGQPTAQVATRPVVLTRRLIQRGTVLEAGMIEVVERPAQGLDPLVVGSLKDVELAEAIRDLPAGTVLRSYDIKRTLLVKKGQTALLTVGQGAGFQVTVRVEAQQDGYFGEQVRLKNTESGRLLSGVVTGPNAVRGLQN